MLYVRLYVTYLSASTRTRQSIENMMKKVSNNNILKWFFLKNFIQCISFRTSYFIYVFHSLCKSATNCRINIGKVRWSFIIRWPVSPDTLFYNNILCKILTWLYLLLRNTSHCSSTFNLVINILTVLTITLYLYIYYIFIQ